MKIKSVRHFKELKDKRILLRSDFNVPIKNGKVKDDFKIIAGLPTIRFLLRHRSKLIILTHLSDSKQSAKPVANRLSRLLGRRVDFISNKSFLEIGTKISEMKNGDVLMLENIRFHKGEKQNNLKLAKDLSFLADIYVNDAFAVSHRKHSSVSAIKKYLPSYAGLLIEKELKNLDKIAKPKKPLIIIMGGSKMSTKIPLVKKLGEKADRILLGGALANNFLFARKYEVGKSLLDFESIKFARRYKNKKIIIPVDVIAKNLKTNKVYVKKVADIVKDDSIFDIGPETVKIYSSYIKKANTLIWNGPLGMFEVKKFQGGTLSIAQLIAARSRGSAFGVVGGGETIEALKMTKMQDHLDWISTGGGAMLSYLGDEAMPGLKGIVKK